MWFDIFSQSQYSFDGKKPYEEVLALLYRHWFVLFMQLVAFGLLALLPFVVYALADGSLASLGLSSAFWFVTAVYFLIWWYAVFYAITMYLLDTWIVTDHRVMDNEQHGFFDRTVAELSLAKIQDISVAVQGPIATFLDFGDLEIQTAGAVRKFIFKQIPHPRRVKDQIVSAHSEYLKCHPDDVETHV